MIHRDEHPFRFTLSVSTLSGVLVAVITAMVGLVFNLRLLSALIPVWSALLAVTIMSVVGAAVGMKRSGNAGQSVFLLVSAFEQKHWLAELVQNICRVLDRQQLDLVVKIPGRDFTGPGQIEDLRRLVKRSAKCQGGFVLPAEPWDTRADLAEISRRANFPIVFLDDEPFTSESEYPPNTCFVRYDPGLIGEMAAKYVIEQLAEPGNGEVRILVIGCRTHQDRQRRFEDRVSQQLPDVEIIVDDNGDFDRDKARWIVSRHLKTPDRLRRAFHVVYCTNDEMALGAVDALQSSPGSARKSTIVVGVDGTREAKALIDSKHSPLRATVCQDSYRVAEIAVGLLARKRAGRSTPCRTLLAPRLYAADQ